MFVNNKRSTTAYGARRSGKKDVGILDPGPVTNHFLLDDQGFPLPNLSKGKNYRGVNKAVWKQLYETYGGGPVLRRNELSIYADDFKEAEVEDVEIDSSAIKKHFKSYAEDEDTQPAVSNEFGESDPTPESLMTHKHKYFDTKRRSKEYSLESNLRKGIPKQLDSNNKGQKGSSIPRRNLFKKRSQNNGGSDIKSPYANKLGRPIYKSFIDKDRSSNDSYHKKFGKGANENSSKELEGRI